MRTLVVFLAAAACSSKSASPPAPTAPPPPATPPVVAIDAAPAKPAPTCLPATLDTPIDSVAITPGHVAFCVGDDAARSCWNVELGTGTYVPSPVAPKRDDPGTPPSATIQPDGSVQLCPARTKPACTAWKPAKPLGDGEISASDDGQIVAHLTTPFELELIDVATTKRRARIPGWKTAMSIPPKSPAPLDLPTFVGDDRVIVWAHATPVSDEGRIYTRDGKLIGPIGPESFTQNNVDSWPIAGSIWAFKQIDSPAFRIVDVATGKLLRELALDALGGNGEASTVAAAGDTIVYVGQYGRIALIDRPSFTIKALTPPICR